MLNFRSQMARIRSSLLAKQIQSAVAQCIAVVSRGEEGRKQRYGFGVLLVGALVSAVWGVSVAAGSSPMSVTDYVAKPAEVGVGGVSTLTATLRSAKNVAPAYALLTVPPHMSITGALPPGCVSGTYDTLAADPQRQLPAKAEMVGPDLMKDVAEVDQSTMVYCKQAQVQENASWPITFSVKGDAVGNRRSFAFAAAGDPLDGGWASEITQSELTVVQTVDLGVTKTATPDPVNAGEEVTYTMVVTNRSIDVAAPAVTLIDDLPAVESFKLTSTLPSGCSLSGTKVTCELGALAAGATKTIEIKGRVLQSRGTQSNSVSANLSAGVTSVTEVNFDQDSPISRNKHSVTVTVKPVIKLAATKTMTGTVGGKIVSGQTVTMALGAKNTGVVTADNVVVTDIVPADFTIIASDARCTTEPASPGTKVSCPVGTLVKDQDRTGIFVFTLKAKETTVALTGTNTAEVTAPRPNDVDVVLKEPAVVDYTIHPSQPVLEITKSKAALIDGKWRSDIPATWNNKLQSTITVSNSAKATADVSKLDASNTPRVITVTETLGAYELYTGFAGDGWACTDPAGATVSMTVTCTYTLAADLPIGKPLPALTINSVAQGSGTQDITNTAKVDQVVANLPAATDSATLKGVPAVAALGLNKTGVLNQPDLNDPSKDTLTYTLTIKNDGPATATNVKVVDTLPMWFKPKTGAASKVTVDFTSSAPAGTTCPRQATDNAVVECILGSLPNNGVAKITITVGHPFKVNDLTNTFGVSSVDTQIPQEGTPSNGGSPGSTPKPVADVTISQVVPPSTPMQVGVSASFRTDFANLGANAAEGVKVRQSVDLTLMDVKSMRLSDQGAGTCSVVRGTPLTDSYVECKMSRPLAADEELQMFVELMPKFGDAYGNLDLDKSCTVTARMARTSLVRDKCADYLVKAMITTDSKQSNDQNDAGSATAKVRKESVDLVIGIEDNYGTVVQDPSPLNAIVGYQLTLSNKGPSVATNVSFYLKATPPNVSGFSMEKQDFPGGLACTEVTPAGGEWGWKCVLTADDGELKPNDTPKTFILPFKVAASDSVLENPGFQTYALSGRVFSSETFVGADEGGIASDSNPSNNQTTQKTVVVPRATLTVEKTASLASVAVREAFNYQIKVTNTGPSAAAKVLVKDTLADNLEYWPSASNITSTLNGVCSASGQVVSCTVPLIKKGEFAVVTIPVRVKLGYTGTSLKNKAQAGPTLDTEGVPSFFPKEPVESDENSVEVKPGKLTGKVVVAVDGTDLSGNPDPITSSWVKVPDTDILVTLSGKDQWDNEVNITAPKKANDGTFTFEGLPPGVYRVTQTQPTGYLDYKDIAPSGNGTAPTTGYVKAGETESFTGVKVEADPLKPTTGLIFAEVKPGSISGFTFLDVDGNKYKSPGDATLNSVLLTLSGKDYTGTLVAADVKQLSASGGAYKFDALPPGTYTVTVTPIASASYIGASRATEVQADAAAPQLAGIILASGGVKVEHNFGFKNNGTVPNTLQGRVYVDLNKNGSWDDGEPGIPGVKVTLSGLIKVDPSDTNPDRNICNRISTSCEATTDSQGKYVFSNLLDSDANGYTVTELPSDPLKLYANGKENAVGSNAIVGDDIFTKVVLNAASQHTSLDFGEYLFSIAGQVEVVSLNATDKKPLEGVVIRIEGTTGAGGALCTAGNYAFPVPHTCDIKTDSSGRYVFPDLPAGTYKVTEVQPLGYGNYANLIGTAAGSQSDASDGKTSIFSGVELSAAATQSDKIDAKNYVFQEAGNALSGWVYIDTNNDGDRQPSEPGIGGVTVTIKEKTTGKTYVTTTKPDGSYSFTGLPDGTYTLVETQPDGYLDGGQKAGGTGGAIVGSACTTKDCNTIDNIKMEGGKTYENYLFAETGATISGKVYEEKIDATTGNSTMGPGLEGVEVRLVSKAADAAAWCAARADKCVTKTKADGSYAFEGVPPGTYDVVKNQNQLAEYYAPKGKAYTDGIETAGKAGGTVENRYFGTQAGYNTIGSIAVTPEKIAQFGGKLEGYLFGVRLGAGTRGLVPPIVNGYVYMDHTHDRVRDPLNTDGQNGWTVVLSTSTGKEICTVHTNADGFYQFDNLHCPGYESGLPTSDSLPGNPTFNIHFNKDGNVLPSMASSGDKVGVPGGGQITGLVLRAADEIVEQNLPLDPEGVVYDAVTRKPVPGAVVGITFNGSGVFDPARHLVGGASVQNQTTGADGRYSFVLWNDFPDGEYVLTIQSVPQAYLPGPSVMIPPCTNAFQSTKLPVGLPALIQAQRDAPGLSQTLHNPQACSGSTAGFANTAPFTAAQQTTQYFLRFVIVRGNASEILNNHIPLDPVLAGGAILVTKTTPKVNVAKGDLVPYTITATNISGGALANVRVRDMLPPGFRYRIGSATWNKLPVEPEVNGRELTWPNQNFATNEKKSYQLLLTVGAGVGEGEYVNQAWAINNQVNERISNVANAVVRVVPDPTFDCSDLIGKVFNDKNANGYQDQGEPGIPNVRVVTARGLLVTTDADGRFHVACAAIPQADRGSNFVMKLDERTLPSGFRMTTENPRDVRVTRGKMVKLNFGATVHKVLRLEVDGRAFAQDGTELSAEWGQQVEPLLAQLAERPTVLRIAYRLTGESKDVAEQRLKALTQRIRDGYAQRAQQQKEKEDDTPPLVIETESFEQNKAEGVR